METGRMLRNSRPPARYLIRRESWTAVGRMTHRWDLTPRESFTSRCWPQRTTSSSSACPFLKNAAKASYLACSPSSARAAVRGSGTTGAVTLGMGTARGAARQRRRRSAPRPSAYRGPRSWRRRGSIVAPSRRGLSRRRPTSAASSQPSLPAWPGRRRPRERRPRAEPRIGRRSAASGGATPLVHGCFIVRERLSSPAGCEAASRLRPRKACSRRCAGKPIALPRHLRWAGSP
mmetsp:Transcript_22401/g.53533  ORF Transcript_22401/g.53533 Transcript_22401/m.53533 type:complete len:233 (+) Transcript_22401:570-1268(+)